jgi:hypothetical protein
MQPQEKEENCNHIVASDLARNFIFNPGRRCNEPEQHHIPAVLEWVDACSETRLPLWGAAGEASIGILVSNVAVTGVYQS